MENKLSSSRHTLSADKKLSVLKKIFWIFINFVNNNLSPKKVISKDSLIKVKKLNILPNEINWNLLNPRYQMSPSRLLGDLFWSELPWELIKDEIGQINIFDTGCGRGLYALFLNKLINDKNSYVGIDFNKRDNWKELMNRNDFITLIENSSSNISEFVDKETNLFITQSAIEHFNYDLEYFQQIKTFIDQEKTNTIQIHLFPSPVCLWLYLFHGVRQYNFRAIMQIIDIFKSTNSYFRIYPLGGNYSNVFHFFKITIPSLLRKWNIGDIDSNEQYTEKLKNSVLNDLKSGISHNPSFYALVIHSNYSKVIF